MGSFDEPSNKRVKKNNFSWTDEAKLALAKCVSKCKAFKKTKDESFGEKYVQVLIRLKRYFPSIFPSDIDMKPGSLQKSFKRFSEEISIKYSISAEGANLSGLSERPPEYDNIMINMIEEAEREKAFNK